jgi:Uma2 family endonuclease
MSIVAVKPRYTPADLLAMPDGDRYELVDGELVERRMGWNASWIGGRLHFFLSAHCEANPVARVAPADAGYQCFPEDPNRVRRPDVSLLRLERLPAHADLEGYCPVAPDLAAEVVSPNDLYYEVEEKVAEYLRAGVRLVWVINPPTRSVRVHRGDGTVTDLGPDDELNGEDIVPGFRCRVGDLFVAPPDRPAPQDATGT